MKTIKKALNSKKSRLTALANRLASMAGRAYGEAARRYLRRMIDDPVYRRKAFAALHIALQLLREIHPVFRRLADFQWDNIGFDDEEQLWA